MHSDWFSHGKEQRNLTFMEKNKETSFSCDRAEYSPVLTDFRTEQSKLILTSIE